MPTLVKITNDDILVAPNFVHAPGYSLIVANMNTSSPVVDGWKYYAEDVAREDFPPKWVQPTGASDAYPLSGKVFHAGKQWESLIHANVWVPGVSGWREVVTLANDAPEWIQPTGAHDAYQSGAIVSYTSFKWKSSIDANVWAPGVFGWVKLITTLPAQAEVIPEWVQPTGAQDAYALNAIVMHNGIKWKNTGSAANVWEPGVFGWVQI